MKRFIQALVFAMATCAVVTLGFTWFDSERVIYLPFQIPGDSAQMAATVPPFGIFIEAEFREEGNGRCSILAHERVHWSQYQRMGLFGFYYAYLTEYWANGRFDHWMEREAREKSCSSKKNAP